MVNMKSIPSGVLDKSYAWGRKNKKSWRYRVKRRTYEVIQAINKYHPSNIDAVLDVGAAEGLILGSIKKKFPKAECVGLEYSQELINLNQNKNIKIVQGDAQNLPFENNSFDIAVATAIIEHLPQPLKMLTEIYRILRPNGILILTTPEPFFDKIAELISKEESHHLEKFGLKKIKNYFQKVNFQILYAEKFMMSPIGFPAELKIEKIIKLLKLDFFLLNQLIIGRKK